MRGRLVLLAAVCLAPRAAHAGRSFFGWQEGAEVMPERSVELQTWVSEENVYSPARDRSKSIWGVAPYIGINDQLELALPLELWWQRTPITPATSTTPRLPAIPGATQLNNYGVELRYRVVSQDPVEAPAFAPLVRVSLHRSVGVRDSMLPELGLVSTYENGRILVGYDISFASEITRDETKFDLRPAVGVSVLAVDDLRFGAEFVGYMPLEDTKKLMWFAAGPNVAWTHGRFWVSATYAIGIDHVKDVPRAQWGIAF